MTCVIVLQQSWKFDENECEVGSVQQLFVLSFILSFGPPDDTGDDRGHGRHQEAETIIE